MQSVLRCPLCFFDYRDDAGRDGNGAPIPDPRRGFPPLGDVIGVFLVPAGTLIGKISSPSGEAGNGTFSKSPSPFPAGDPEYISNA
jgi:hypothetical protein